VAGHRGWGRPADRRSVTLAVVRRRVTFSRNLNPLAVAARAVLCKYCAFKTNRAQPVRPDEVLGILDARERTQGAAGPHGRAPEVNAEVARGWPPTGHEGFTRLRRVDVRAPRWRAGLIPHTNLGRRERRGPGAGWRPPRRVTA